MRRKLLCWLGRHSWFYEVHYGEYPKAVCKASIIQECRHCGKTHLISYEKTTRFVVSTKYLKENHHIRPRLKIVK